VDSHARQPVVLGSEADWTAALAVRKAGMTVAAVACGQRISRSAVAMRVPAGCVGQNHA